MMENEKTHEECLSIFAEVLLQVLHENPKTDLENFEHYTNILQTKIFKDPTTYIHRLQLGYSILLQELAQKKGFVA